MGTELGTNIGRVPRSLWMLIVRLAEARFPPFFFLLRLNMLKYRFYADHVKYLNETGFLFLFLNWGATENLVRYNTVKSMGTYAVGTRMGSGFVGRKESGELRGFSGNNLH